MSVRSRPRHWRRAGVTARTAAEKLRGRHGHDAVAIIGAGIGGVYLAAELGILGAKLRLHDTDDSRLAALRARGGLEVEGAAALPRSSG